MLEREIIITKETKGVFTSNVEGFKLVEENGLKKYVNVIVNENSTFKVINFNVLTKRLMLFVHNKGLSPEVIEVSYKNILDYTILDNISSNQAIEAVIITDRIKYIISKENIKMIVIYAFIILSSIMIGKFL